MAAPYNPPKRGEDFVIYVALSDMANPGRNKADPTLATGDVKVKKDAGALANIGTLPAVDFAGERMVRLALTATEMTADVVTIEFHDVTDPPEWADLVISIPTT